MEALMIVATAQALIGAFDLAYHHEVTERLTWKKTASAELKLHAARSHAVGQAPQTAVPAADLVNDYLDRTRRVLITGGTGFIGRRLTAALVEAGHHVTVLTRDARKARDLPLPVRITTALASFGDDEVFDAIVHLAGAPVATRRWTAKRKALLRASRIDMTRALVAFIGRLETKPEVLIAASAIGYYGADSERPVTESTEPEPGFSNAMCAACEAEPRKACRYGVRVVQVRLGLVLAAHGGPLAMMMPAFEFGLGARLGSGQQWMSWIHLDDVIAMIAFLIARDDLRGPFNAVAPVPVRNAQFSTALARHLGRPCLFAIPSWLIRLAFGEMGQELLLASKRVQPIRLCKAGFGFRYPGLDEALRVSLTPEPSQPNRAV